MSNDISKESTNMFNGMKKAALVVGGKIDKYN